MLLRTSLIGTVVVALCCFTPILVVLLGALGLAALTGYLDYVLLPALVFFIGLTVYAFWRKKKYEACCKSPSNKESIL
ncbi:membrane protein [Marinobacter sp. EVN1]|jgi:mercuric ion transport protein|nr:membrane protein [Marinobacter sp. EVN1]